MEFRDPRTTVRQVIIQQLIQKKKTIEPGTDLLRLEEILSIIQQHLLNAGIEHDRRYRPLVARVCPAPTTMGVCEVDLDAVDGFGLVFPLRLEN
jgi:hypothetical protein